MRNIWVAVVGFRLQENKFLGLGVQGLMVRGLRGDCKVAGFAIGLAKVESLGSIGCRV